MDMDNEVSFSLIVSDYEDSEATYEIVVDLVTKKVKTIRSPRLGHQGRAAPSIRFECLTVEISEEFIKANRKARKHPGVLVIVYP